MIEVTDEMVQLALNKFLCAPADNIEQIDARMREGLAAVLALVERDHPEIERARLDDLEAGHSEMAAQRAQDEEPF